MIYTVTFNPSLDYVVDVPDVAMNNINRTTGERIVPGGKGINMSAVLTNFGVDTRAISFVAGFTGDALKNLLAERNINADYINVESGMTRINVKIRSNGETEINGKGPEVTNAHVSVLYEKLDYLDDADVLVLAGSLPNTLSDTTYMEIMERLDYKNIKVVIDAEKKLVLNTLKFRPFLIKPNTKELGDMFDVTITSREETVEYAKKLMDMGARNVLVSMGKDGAMLLTEDGNIYEAKAPAGEVKNTVGAGDAMVAGFLAGYTKTENFDKAFKLGICAGSASAFSDDYATKEATEALFKENFPA